MAIPLDSSHGLESIALAPVEDWNIDPQALQMGECIGEGSFGKVFKAKYLGIDVAVKKIMESVEQASEFEHEVAVLKYAKLALALFRLDQEFGL
jgi:serine/threonine protein kinase